MLCKSDTGLTENVLCYAYLAVEHFLWETLLEYIWKRNYKVLRSHRTSRSYNCALDKHRGLRSRWHKGGYFDIFWTSWRSFAATNRVLLCDRRLTTISTHSFVLHLRLRSLGQTIGEKINAYSKYLTASISLHNLKLFYMQNRLKK